MNGGRSPEATAAVDAILARGVERYRGGDVKEAASLWRDAVQLAPGDERARAYLAWAESRLLVEDPSSVAPSEESGGAALSDSGWLDESLGESDAVAPGDPDDPEEAGTGAWIRPAGVVDTVADGAVPLDTADDEDDWKRETTLPWHPAHDAAAEGRQEPQAYPGAEAPVRRFLARTPTQPNLPPLDVPVLSEERMAALAGVAAPESHAQPPRDPQLPPHAPPHPLGQSSVRADAPPPPPRPHADADASLADQTMPTQFEAMSPPDAVAEEDWSSLADEPEPEIDPVPGPVTEEKASDGPPPVTEVSLEVDEEEALPPFPVGPSAPPPLLDELLDGARRALARGDEEGAFTLAERAAEKVGGLSAPSLAAQRAWLLPLYERHLGDGSRTVRLGSLPPSLDARSAFLLSRVDGTFSIDDLLDISGMDRADAARHVALLLKNGALRAD